MKSKVLHVSAGGLGYGGVSSVIFSIVEQLHTEFDFECVVFQCARERETCFLNYGPIRRIDCYPKKGKRNYLELILRPWKLYFGIRRICKNEKYDVIHCHNQRDAWICLLAAKHAGVKIRIAHSHNTNSPKRKNIVEKVYKQISPKMLTKVSTINIGCSRAACKDLFEHDNFEVVLNAVNLQRFVPQKRSAKTRLEFVHVGRYTYQKNQEFLLDAFAEICKRFPTAHLNLVGYGEPDFVQRLKNQIQVLGISNNVELVPGDAVNVADYYARSDYMIFPSRFEGFGIVLIEAQAMGVQCYVSENIQPEADVGLLTFLNLSDGPKKWAEHIIQDIDNGNEKALDHEKLAQYSIENVAKRYAAIYRGETMQ